MSEAAGRQASSTDAGRSGVEAATIGTIVVLNRDLMFGVRIGNGLRSLGYVVRFASDTAGFVDLVRASVPPPILGIVDMNAGVDWDLVRALVDDAGVVTPILAFGPHLDVANRRAAKAAGVDRLVTNGEFHRDMVGLVRRYALPVPDDA